MGDKGDYVQRGGVVWRTLYVSIYYRWGSTIAYGNKAWMLLLVLRHLAVQLEVTIA